MKRAPAPRGSRRPLPAVLLAGLAAACGGESAEPPLSAVLVTLDTTRADAVGAYGGPRPLTPVLDRLAREGVLYESAYTVTPLTLPAHASMLTGLDPLRHGVRENGLWALSGEADTLAERAREAGFQTAAFLAAIVLDERFGLDQGFEHYDLPERPAVQASTYPAERRGHEVVARALTWLAERDPERPFFLWVHLFDPHGPWDAPEAFRKGPARDSPYHAEVAVADDALGQLCAYLEREGLLDTTFLAVVADHGEGLGDHGEPSHGAFAYESTLRVPFLVRYPDGRRAGERDTSVVSVVDVFPTLLEAMGLAVPGGVDGLSLYGGAVPEDRGVYFESYAGYIAHGWSPLAGWLDAEGKYVHSSRPQLFDVRADPGETQNLIRAREGELGRYREAIRELAERPVLEPSGTDVLDQELAAELRALGYAAVGAPGEPLPHPLAPSERPSPPSQMQAYRRALFAMELANRGQLEEAASELAALVADNPDDFFARDRLGDALKRLQRHTEAIPHLRRVVEDGPAWSYSRFTLGICLMETGEHEEALAVFRAALAQDAGLAATVRAMLDTLRRRGDEALAERYAQLLQ